MARIVLNTIAVTQLAHHFSVIAHALTETLGFNQFIHRAQLLEALAELADIPFSELCEYEEDLFMGLLAEKQVAVTAQHRLRKKFRDLKAGKQHTTAQQKFEGFFARVGGALASA